MNQTCFSLGFSLYNSSHLNNTINPNLPCPSGPQFSAFINAAYVAAIYLSIISVLTLAANLPLFVVFIKNPKKIRRIPTAYFLVGVAIADVITALMMEPCLFFCYFWLYMKGFGDPFYWETCPRMYILAFTSGTITMTASYIIVLAFTVTQYLAAAYPLKMARHVTTKNVIITLVCIWMYCFAFGVGFTVAGELTLAREIDIYVHTLLESALTLICYALLFQAFRRKKTRSDQLQSESSTHNTKGQTQRIQVENKFVTINLLLIAVLAVCNMPSTIMWFVQLTKSDVDLETMMRYNLLSDCIFSTKFLMDSLAYVWLFPVYRTAMRHVCCCCSRFVNKEVKLQNASNLPLAVYQHKTSTVTLSSVQTNIN